MFEYLSSIADVIDRVLAYALEISINVTSRDIMNFGCDKISPL